MSDVLSPTPPVLCLSILGPGMSERSSTAPLASIASVSARVSCSLIPWMLTAMRKAEIW